jgi:hypothetical protein
MGGAAVKRRFAACLHAILISIDQLGGCWIRCWCYLFAGGEQPNPDETISSWVGRHAVADERWALASERFIDALFGAGHCRRSIGS